MFLLVPAHPGSPGQRAVKRLLLLCCCAIMFITRTVVIAVYSQTTMLYKYCIIIVIIDLKCRSVSGIVKMNYASLFV